MSNQLFRKYIDIVDLHSQPVEEGLGSKVGAGLLSLAALGSAPAAAADGNVYQQARDKFSNTTPSLVKAPSQIKAPSLTAPTTKAAKGTASSPDLPKVRTRPPLTPEQMANLAFRLRAQLDIDPQDKLDYQPWRSGR